MDYVKMCINHNPSGTVENSPPIHDTFGEIDLLSIFTMMAALAMVLISGCSESMESTDTAIYRGNLQRTGVFEKESGVEIFSKLKWSFKANDWFFSSAAIANNTVYLGGVNGYFYAL